MPGDIFKLVFSFVPLTQLQSWGEICSFSQEFASDVSIICYGDFLPCSFSSIFSPIEQLTCAGLYHGDIGYYCHLFLGAEFCVISAILANNVDLVIYYLYRCPRNKLHHDDCVPTDLYLLYINLAIDYASIEVFLVLFSTLKCARELSNDVISELILVFNEHKYNVIAGAFQLGNSSAFAELLDNLADKNYNGTSTSLCAEDDSSTKWSILGFILEQKPNYISRNMISKIPLLRALINSCKTSTIEEDRIKNVYLELCDVLEGKSVDPDTTTQLVRDYGLSVLAPNMFRYGIDGVIPSEVLYNPDYVVRGYNNIGYIPEAFVISGLLQRNLYSIIGYRPAKCGTTTLWHTYFGHRFTNTFDPEAVARISARNIYISDTHSGEYHISPNQDFLDRARKIILFV